MSVDAHPRILVHTGSLIRRAQQRHVAIWLKEVSTDVTSVQYAVLFVLEQRPGVSQRELGDELDLDRSTIAELAARMVRNGMLERVADPHDKRRNALYLTEQGRAQLQVLKPRVDSVEQVLTQHLSGDERDALRALLEQLLIEPQ
ncbi:MAG: MarR family winged helix-turn-helix transcriptional regulator [Pseudomonas sp.]|nr:MarR family winged helix-turn-helix transcriptional regulator [Pseudomonas sp.]MDE1169332.1 MarR family winged helix-turn-helix transcriptional regulator [Pseudomonas sp.]